MPLPKPLLFRVAAFSLLFRNVALAALSVDQLTCEYLKDPIGIDVAQPRLSWILNSRERDQYQTGWQIIAASEESTLNEGTADLWDSGKVRSDDTLQIPYSGKPLDSSQRCYWKVRVWDKEGEPSAWSQTAFWEMGLLHTNDWRGQWIGRTADTNSQPAPLFRRVFDVRGNVKRARAYICGLGYYELHINGKRIGDHLLDPRYTRYDKRVLYATYDVTETLKRGKNAIGVILGNGWYNVHTLAVWDFHKAPWRAAPKLLMQLEIEYADGRTETIATDTAWKTSTGPITFDSIYSGQTYVVSLAKPGWDTPGYHEMGWKPAILVEAPTGRLGAQAMPPIRAEKTLKPIKITEPKPGVFVFDFGQNFAGFAELDFARTPWPKPPRGYGSISTLTLRYSERLGKDGIIDRADIQQHVLRLDTNQTFQTDTYILDGTREAIRKTHDVPRFCYHGFQYVELTGFPGKPTLDTLKGVFIHSDVATAGTFECSNPLVNKIWRASRWSYLSNLQGIPTDCPHREKNGWTGDAHLAAEPGLFNFAPAAVYTKWIGDLADEQQPTGELPGIVPTSGWGYKWGNGPAWDSAFELIPLYLYDYCGDSRILRQNYQGFKRYVDYLTTKAKDGIVSIGLNDWAPWETKTPADVTSTAYYYKDAQIVALAARLRGDTRAAQEYTDLAASIKKAFNAKFYHPDTGLYANGSQTALSCALYQGLVKPENKPMVFSNLLAAIEKRNGHIDTGILGAKYILNALLENGRADVAYRIVTQKDKPGWGWWFEQGATTLWEQWNGTESRNHIMFGDVSAWFYKALAGINPESSLESWLQPPRTAFKEIIIKPNPVGDLTWAKASYDSARGRIVSDWRIAHGKFLLTVEVPPNCTATVFLPTAQMVQVREGEHVASEAAGVNSLGIRDQRVAFRVASGSYHFVCPAPARQP